MATPVTDESPPVVTLPADFLPRLAEEVWRLNKRVQRLARTLGDEPLRGIRDSTGRLQDLLVQAGIRAEDHDGQPYREGTRLDILHVEGSPGPEDPLWVTETVKPTIMLGDRVIRPGQVILGQVQPEGES